MYVLSQCNYLWKIRNYYQACVWRWSGRWGRCRGRPRRNARWKFTSRDVKIDVPTVGPAPLRPRTSHRFTVIPSSILDLLSLTSLSNTQNTKLKLCKSTNVSKILNSKYNMRNHKHHRFCMIKFFIYLL